MTGYYKNRDTTALDGETFNDVPGFDGVYAASNYGRIMSMERVDANGRHRKPLILSQCLNNNGQLCVNLYSDGKAKYFAVSQLVYFAFKGLKGSESEKIGHVDKNKRNNVLENLEIQTQEKVCLDSVKYGLTIDWGIGAYQKNQTEKIYREFDPQPGRRICTKCFEEKDITRFHQRNGSSMGRNRVCADCKNFADGVKDVGRNVFFAELRDRGLKKCKKCDMVKRIADFKNRDCGLAAYCESCEKRTYLERKTLMATQRK